MRWRQRAAAPAASAAGISSHRKREIHVHTHRNCGAGPSPDSFLARAPYLGHPSRLSPHAPSTESRGRASPGCLTAGCAHLAAARTALCFCKRIPHLERASLQCARIVRIRPPARPPARFKLLSTNSGEPSPPPSVLVPTAVPLPSAALLHGAVQLGDSEDDGGQGVAESRGRWGNLAFWAAAAKTTMRLSYSTPPRRPP